MICNRHVDLWSTQGLLISPRVGGGVVSKVEEELVQALVLCLRFCVDTRERWHCLRLRVWWQGRTIFPRREITVATSPVSLGVTGELGALELKKLRRERTRREMKIRGRGGFDKRIHVCKFTPSPILRMTWNLLSCSSMVGVKELASYG